MHFCHPVVRNLRCEGRKQAERFCKLKNNVDCGVPQGLSRQGKRGKNLQLGTTYIKKGFIAQTKTRPFGRVWQ